MSDRKFDHNNNFIFNSNKNFVHALIWTCAGGNIFFYYPIGHVVFKSAFQLSNFLIWFHERHLERIWRRDRTDSNRSRLNAQVHMCNRLMSKAKKNYYTNSVSENITNPRKLWDKKKHILHKKNKKYTRYFRIVHAIPNLLALSMIFS